MLDWDMVALLDGRPLDERRIGGRMLDWDTVTLLDERPLDGREGAGLGYGGVAELPGDS